MGFKNEAALYPHVKSFFENKGYVVKSEVKKCDVVAVKGEDVLVVELKKSFSLKLVMQAVERQKYCSSVYVAFPVTDAIRARKRMSEVKLLLKRLHLGMILIDERPSGVLVEVALVPKFEVFREDKKAQKALLKEFNERKFDLNTGGMTKSKIVTAYRERVINVACFLRMNGPTQVKEIKQATELMDVQSIVSGNHYGWFNRTAKGIYEFEDSQLSKLMEFDALVVFYENYYLDRLVDKDE